MVAIRNIGAAQLLLWAGSSAAWDYIRSGRQWAAVQAYRGELERGLLSIAEPTVATVEIDEHRTVVRDQSFCSRLTLVSASPDALAKILDAVSTSQLLPGYWKPSMSGLLLDADEHVALCVVGGGREAARVQDIYHELEPQADGRLLVHDVDSPVAPYCRYECAADPDLVRNLIDKTFAKRAPNPEIRFLGRAVSVETRMKLSVELSNARGSQAAFTHFLTSNGVEENMVVATEAENPRYFWRASHIDVALPRVRAIPHLRNLIAEFRRQHGSLNKAFIAGIEV